MVNVNYIILQILAMSTTAVTIACAACSKPLPISKDRRTVAAVSSILQTVVISVAGTDAAADAYLSSRSHVCEACFAVLQKYRSLISR